MGIRHGIHALFPTPGFTTQVTIQISFIDIEEALNILCQAEGLTVIIFLPPNG